MHFQLGKRGEVALKYLSNKGEKNFHSYFNIRHNYDKECTVILSENDPSQKKITTYSLRQLFS
jgi:hypothetical protein